MLKGDEEYLANIKFHNRVGIKTSRKHMIFRGGGGGGGGGGEAMIMNTKRNKHFIL